MTDETYFFDTYAIMEIAQEAEKYRPFLGCRAVTTALNLFEMYYCTCRDWGKDVAERLAALYRETVVEYGLDIVKEAALMRLEHRKRNLSMTDCIGYVIAKRLGVRFLTGDVQFREMPNVEFVRGA
jgi:predicted nucleic acid-binding protein